MEHFIHKPDGTLELNDPWKPGTRIRYLDCEGVIINKALTEKYYIEENKKEPNTWFFVAYDKGAWLGMELITDKRGCTII